MAIIALMTDFGTRDHYVAAMKGMVLQIDPKAMLVDITHEIDPQDVIGAAFTLRHVFPCFPAHTIFIAVVDPMVGTGRRILAARYSDRIVLAPDNGLLTFVHRDAQLQEIRSVENRQFLAGTLSCTFHGRDIFAPVAAHLSRGVAMDRLGPPVDRIEAIEVARPEFARNGTITGRVLHIDRFGNLITNIAAIDLAGHRFAEGVRQIHLGDRLIGRLRITYSDVAPGEPLALIGSTQMLEIAVNQGNAADLFHVHRGDPVRVSPDMGQLPPCNPGPSDDNIIGL